MQGGARSARMRERRTSTSVSGVDDQAEHLARVEVEQLGRRVDARHERHVAGLVAAVREVHRERRLRGARDADQHEVGLEAACAGSRRRRGAPRTRRPRPGAGRRRRSRGAPRPGAAARARCAPTTAEIRGPSRSTVGTPRCWPSSRTARARSSVDEREDDQRAGLGRRARGRARAGPACASRRRCAAASAWGTGSSPRAPRRPPSHRCRRRRRRSRGGCWTRRACAMRQRLPARRRR